MPNANYDNTVKYYQGARFHFVCDGTTWRDAGGTLQCSPAGQESNLASAQGVGTVNAAGTTSVGAGSVCVPICVPIKCKPYVLADYNMVVGDAAPGPACAAASDNICNIDPTVLGYTPSPYPRPGATAGCTEQCAITCAPGYHDVSAAGTTNSAGKGWLQCLPVAGSTTGAVVNTPTITCEANWCAPYYLPSGTIGAGAFPCYNGTILVTDASNGGNTTCELQCKEGYGMDPLPPGTARLPAQSIVCAPGSQVGASPVSYDGANQVPLATLQGAASSGCKENKCKAFDVDSTAICGNNGNLDCLVQGSSGTACTIVGANPGQVTLTTITERSCTLTCASGYLRTGSTDLTLSCRIEAVDGQTEVTLSPGTFKCQATCQAWFDRGNVCGGTRNTQVGSPEKVVCPSGDYGQCSQTWCCAADCNVAAHPRVNGVEATTLAPTACVAGGTVPNGTQCTWSVKRGYNCPTSTLVQTCTAGRTIVAPSSCVPTCASFPCNAAAFQQAKPSSDPNLVLCAGVVCTAAECCNVGCRVPQFGSDIGNIGSPAVPPLNITPTDVCGDGTSANKVVMHNTVCTYSSVTNAQCTGTGSSTCVNGVWTGDWTATSYPSCLPVCGVADTTSKTASPPGLVDCTAPFQRKPNPSTIVCTQGVCDDATCCNADCPTHFVNGAWLLGVGCPNAMATNYGSGTLPVYHGTTCTWQASAGWNCTWEGDVYCNDGTWQYAGTTVTAGAPRCSPLCSGHPCLGNLVPIPLASTTICTTGACTDNLCCLEPCRVQAIPMYGTNAMATVTPSTTCVPGAQVVHGTECSWVAEAGYFCMYAGKRVCDNQVWSQDDLNCTATCSVHNCAPTPATPPARDPVRKANAGSILCPNKVCTNTACCDAPCTVQTLPLDQTYLATTASDVGSLNVPMITLDSQCNDLLTANGYTGWTDAAVSGTVCTWDNVAGYTCSGLGTTTCVDGVWSQPLPVCVPLCQSYKCGTVGSNTASKAQNCQNCLLKADQNTRQCATGVCDDNNCCDAACDTPIAPFTNQSNTVTVKHAVLVPPCVENSKASIRHGQLCSWSVQPGYTCEGADPWVCNDGSQTSVPICYATCLNTGIAWDNAACSKRTGFVPKANQADIRCGRDLATPGDACTEELCCDYACDHPAFTCPAGYVPKTDWHNIRCGASLSLCTTGTCCEAAACPANAGPPGICGCNAGYGAFPAVAWDPVAGVWTHSCFAMCNHTSGPCRGVGLTVKSPPPMCVGPDPLRNCSVSTCCDVSCASPAFTACTGMRGLALRPNATSIPCGRSAALCSVQHCCQATCESVEFTGCTATSAATGWVLKNAAPTVMCDGYHGYACTRERCCDATVCSNYVCSRGKGKKSDANRIDCGLLPCTDQMCCKDNTCASPVTVGTVSPYEQCYAFADGTGECTTVSTCTPAICKPGCTGIANVSCDADGGTFSISGCRPNQCIPPGSIDFPAYAFAGGSGTCDNINTCGTVTCRSGYHFEIPLFNSRDARALQADRSYSSPTCFCDLDGGNFRCYGCFENQCAPPLQTLLGYRFHGSAATCTMVSTCRIRGCRNGYLRTADPMSLQCQTHGGLFTATGCSPIPCPQWARTTPATVCECSPGYRYVRNDGVQAPLWSGTQWMHRCERVACPAFSETTSTEPCRCRQGYSGAPLWDVASGTWLHRCTPALCPVNARRACDGFGVCNCQCNEGFLTSAAGSQAAGIWNYTLGRWVHNCSSICPRGYTYDESKATWDGVKWNYACVEAVCPASATRVPASGGTVSCVCGAGTEGSPQWNEAKLRWDHVCGPPRSSVNCPDNSGPAGTCTCLDGYATSNMAGSPVAGPVWSGTGWAHTCTRVACPANAAWGTVMPGNYQACVCNPGFCGTPVWSITRQVWAHTCVAGTGCGVVGGTNPPVAVGSVCTNNLCAVAFSPVVIPANRDGPNTYVRDNYLNIIPTAGRVVSCNPDNSGLLSQSAIDGTGRLRVLPVQAQYGSTTVRCTVADSGVQKSAFNFVVTVVEPTGIPAPSGTQFWQRVQLTTNAPFRRSTFADAVKQISSRPLRDVRVWYVCPVSACPGAVCPTTHQGRLDAGCAAEDDIPLGRRAAPEQSTVGQTVGEQVYVDFQGFAQDESLSDSAVQQQLSADLQAHIASCAAGQTCYFTSQGSQVGGGALVPAVTSRVPATPTPGGGGGSDDSSLPTGAIIGIVIGCIACCLLLILLVVLLMRSSKDKKKHDENARMTSPDDSAGSYGEYGSRRAMYSQAEKASPPGIYGDFAADEPVKALYDGEYHEGHVWTKDADGTYTITWLDGSHTTGVHADDIIRAGSVGGAHG